MRSHLTANFLYQDIVLASASPQRAALLLEYGFRFKVFPANIDESFAPESTPPQVAETLAIKKAEAIVARFPNAIILGADTIVVSPNGKILGKPRNREHAAEMIREKKSQTEQVLTGFCLLSEYGLVSGVERSEVSYRAFSETELQTLLDSDEWKEVAGALRIEGKETRKLVQEIKGDYHNIIGLPVGRIAQILRDFPMPG